MSREAKSQRSRRKSRASLVPHEEVRKELLRDPETRFYYNALKIQREVGQALAHARETAGLTQAEVAERAGTTQPAIARLEAGRGGVPSLDLLNRVASAVGLRLTVGFRADKAA